MIFSQDQKVNSQLSIFLALVVAGLSSSSCIDAAMALPAASRNLAPVKSPVKTLVKTQSKTAVSNATKTNSASIPTLEAKVVSEPNNAEAHFLLGQAYLKSKDTLKAREHFRAAVRLGRGSASAQRANLALMAMPSQMIKPKTGPQTRMIASMLGLGRTRGMGGAALPTVIDFYANWCQPCKQLDTALAKVKTTYGEKVTFMRVDVDDPNSQPLMDQYEVSPIPTVVFLNPEGEVVSYSIGSSSEGSISSNINKILK
ncbi:hypothetical protein BH11CYA1_BH11CYA1_42170 [soil metagenome]